MKFKNLKTGAILIPTSSFIEEQMKNSDLYEEVKEENKKTKSK